MVVFFLLLKTIIRHDTIEDEDQKGLSRNDIVDMDIFYNNNNSCLAFHILSVFFYDKGFKVLWWFLIIILCPQLS